MSIRALTVAAIIAVLFAFAGCSGGNPVASDFDGKVATISGSAGGDGVFMRAKLHLDTDTMTATINPDRSNMALGDVLADLEITSFLAYPFCTDATCLYVKGLGIEAGTPPDIKLTIGVRHPFGVFNTANPPTGTNRADLDLFDLRVYLINDGGTAPNPEKATITGLSAVPIIFTPGFIVSADGYDDGADAVAVNAADGLDATESVEVTAYNYGGTTTMQPYMKVFAGAADAFGFTPGGTPVADDNRMSHGEADDCTFVLNLAPGGGAIDFDVAIAGGYGQSAQGKTNRTPTLVKYFKSFRAQRPFIGLQAPATTDGTTTPAVLPTLNFWITHAWTGLTAAADKDTYKAQANNGASLPPGAKGPALTDLTFACRVTDGVNTYDYSTLPVPTGTGTNADPWMFMLNLEQPLTPGTAIPNGTYMAYIYVKADTGTSTEYPFVGTDNYTLYYAMDLAVVTLP